MTTEHHTNTAGDSSQLPASTAFSPQRLILYCSIIFLLALGVRLLVWQHNRAAIEQVMTQLTITYKDDARTLARGDFGLFVRGANPPSNANVLAHPPGYSMLMAALFALTGESDAGVRLFQILCDAISALLIFLIALELTTKRVAVIAGALVALSPQLAYNSLLLLPDSLSVTPILLAVYLFIRARGRERGWPKLFIAGALIGLSCWLRPNALLLPLFLAALVPLIFKRGQRLRAAVALVFACLLMIAPLTIRNAMVFHKFIPVSLGSGVTMIEGIADYDSQGRFGLPQTDMEVMRQEASIYKREDYAGTLYNPDGVERERGRTTRGLAVIAAHPFWFAGVMARRAASMLRMERVPVIAGSPLKLDSDEASMTTKLLKLPGVLLKSIQKIFVTAIMLPLFLVGIILLTKARDKHALALLLIVPLYYLSVQSLLHTEYRYVIAIQYFILIFVAVTIAWAGEALRRRLKTNE
ncbi:MAG TPA: glycosyltransferase family 39 protein [Pyrinomonadaceae bacterium]